MKVAVASGKGGTGKTTIATNLAHLAAGEGRSVAYLDCGVEEPNGHIFLKPEVDRQQPIFKLVPEIDDQACTHCGQCATSCRFGAIASLPERTIVFDDLCHGCGGCTLACPVGAIREVQRPIGELRSGHSGDVLFCEGRLDVGEAMSPPAVSAVKRAAPAAELSVFDAPPGTSCPVVETLRGSDVVLLVTEPTPFGLHDLRLAVEMVRAMRLPCAVVVNRADAGNGEVRAYCAREGLPIWCEIPDDRTVAETYSRGQLVCDVAPVFRDRIAELLHCLDLEGRP